MGSQRLDPWPCQRANGKLAKGIISYYGRTTRLVRDLLSTTPFMEDGQISALKVMVGKSMITELVKVGRTSLSYP